MAPDGVIDWMCVPDLGGPAVFAALLDPERGGRFAITLTSAYTTQRRYLPDTNVLETTRCWSAERGAYTFHPNSDGLDAAVLLAVGPFVYRYRGAQDDEGARSSRARSGRSRHWR